MPSTIPSARRGLAATAIAVLLAGVAACSGSGDTSPPTSAPVTRPISTTGSTPTPHSTPQTQAPPKPDVRAEIAARIRREPQGAVSIAAVNLANGKHFVAGAKKGMWTASCYKLLVLEALLLERQDGGSTLSDGEASQATTMIENSDNVAGYSLFLDAGGRPGLGSAAERLGMTHTIPGESDPTFTTTGASDYLALLKNLVGPGPLSKNSRRYTLGLMREVEADQRWGVGVLADRGTDFANKNGWLSIDDSNGPGEQDDGLWAVNSVGVVTMRGHRVLVSIFTQHQQSFGAGIKLVQSLARTIRPALV